MMRNVKLGLFLDSAAVDSSRPVAPWGEIRATAQLAEQVGFDGIFAPDHLILRQSPFWGITDTAPRAALEAWTVLSTLAGITDRVELGSFVACNSFRNPALLAKMAATLDETSGGRLVLGLGAGSYEPEHEAFGYPYDHLGGRLEESLEILVPLLREGRVDFTGRYHKARDCELFPPARPGRPPIWVAAYGPRLMRLAARFADAFATAWHTSPTALSAIFDEFAEACDAAGREPKTITRVVGTFVALGPDADTSGRRSGSLRGDPQDVAAQLEALHTAGADYLVCWVSPGGRRGVERFAEVIAALRGTPVHDSEPSLKG